VNGSCGNAACTRSSLSPTSTNNDSARLEPCRGAAGEDAPHDVEAVAAGTQRKVGLVQVLGQAVTVISASLTYGGLATIRS
jgi:hypothetical protein